MQIDISLFSILDILTASTALMLGLLFFTIKSQNRKANIFLGLFLWSISIQLINGIVFDYYEEEDLEFTFLFFDPILFILLFLFFYLNTTINKIINKWYYLLLIPGIIHNISINVEALDEVFEDYDDLILVFYFFEILLLVYVFRILRNHKKKISNFYSELEFKSLSWLKSILIAILLFHFILIVEGITGVEEAENEVWEGIFQFSSVILLLFIVYWIGYNGFSQPEIFKQYLFQREDIDVELQLKEQDSSKELQEKFSEITSIIEQEKLYTNPKLNLRTLSVELDIKERELSKLINHGSDSNFYHFINKFRVEEFKRLLQSPKAKQLSILGLSQEAGFTSKSTFYSTFKSFESMTPKQYELSLKKSE
ncbi:helix-turn-helix domain-containing protein [Kordia sp.]|uniref:helix-turn-helix domain-containing protein n=1 Tax=Kordia sp. TaxID=1965332 RepID=UPI0025BB7905|nr:helix-turn-helix domain-containing protein [Kordia sp.]MCH2196726.1 helix-turn-helix domain-containing protein [Kordia sp.]